MDKITLILIVIIIIAILAIFVITIKQRKSKNQKITRPELIRKFQLLKVQYKKAKADGCDVSEIEKIGKQAKQSLSKGDYQRVNVLMEKVASLMKNFK